MTRFSSRLAMLLYGALVGLMWFVAIVVLASIVIVIGDALSPGIFGEVHINKGAIEPETAGEVFAVIAIMLLGLALVAGAFVPLIGMLKTTAAGNPFDPANIRRLHTIAGVIAIAIVAQIVLPFALPAKIAETMVEPFSGSTVFALLLTLVLAEVFREGVRLREDAALTV